MNPGDHNNPRKSGQHFVTKQIFIRFFLIFTISYISIQPNMAYSQIAHPIEVSPMSPSRAAITKVLTNFGALQQIYMDGVQAYDQGDYHYSATTWRTLADLGHANAQYQFGALLMHGRGIKKDIKTSLDYFRKAAAQGHVQAQYNMGVAFAKGIGVAQDTGEAVVWWRVSAMNGNADAQFNLGLMYSNGYGVKKDMVVAARWWRQAAVQGDAAAQFNLGMLYASGNGVGQSWKAAINLWKQSAEQGFTHAVRALEVLEQNENEQ